MRTVLLDVHLLPARVDPRHVQHDAAQGWFAEAGASSATRPIAENGLVRVAGHPSYSKSPGGAGVVADVLRQLCTAGGHVFRADDVSLRQVLAPDAVLLDAQITDVYLLALAVLHGGVLATLDRRIPATAVPGDAGALGIVPA